MSSAPSFERDSLAFDRRLIFLAFAVDSSTDWNEALKLWDVTSYPELEELPPAPPSSITTESRVEAVKQD